MRLAALNRRSFVAAALLSMLAPEVAGALTDEERTALADISRALQGIRTMNGEFVQFNPNGEQQQGRFFIARPGRVRFQYDPPATISVVADGKSVLVFDKKLQTYDIWPLSQTPLRLLLDSGLDLATTDKVTRVAVEPDLVEVELQDETRFSAGTLNLIFDRENYDLRQWTVTDQQGLQTMVALYNVETGNQLSAELFEIDYQAATNAAREKR
ncbi:MAG TPA: outer membrane lipoprotein carrier protein LolA [Propylenella sp.]